VANSENNLTEHVRRLIIRRILEGEYAPGSRLPTEREMALATDTSRITVRRAYEQLEEAGIITRRRGSGTRVSRSFRGNSGRLTRIALVSTIREPFAVEFIEAAEKAVTENDALFVLALTDGERGESSVAVRLAGEGIRNIVVWGSERRDDALFERLRVLGVNIVFFDRIVPGPYADFIGLDNRHAIETIVADAVSTGCENLFFIDAAPMDYDSNRERTDAFRLECAKFAVRAETVTARGGFACEDAVARLRSLLSDAGTERSAVVCVNDELALRLAGFADAFSRVRIYGVDGRPEALEAGVVSYAQPMAEMAGAAVRALERQRRLGDAWRASRRRFKGELVAG